MSDSIYLTIRFDPPILPDVLERIKAYMANDRDFPVLTETGCTETYWRRCSLDMEEVSALLSAIGTTGTGAWRADRLDGWSRTTTNFQWTAEPDPMVQGALWAYDALSEEQKRAFRLRLGFEAPMWSA